MKQCVQLSCRAMQPPWSSAVGSGTGTLARAERGEEIEAVPRAGSGRETELGQQREVGRRQPWVTLPERQKKPA